MGLTIHYKLKSDVKSIDESRKLVGALRECALRLPFKEAFKEVGNIVEFEDADCGFNKTGIEDEYRWLKVQSRRYIDDGSYSFGVIPSHIIAFSTWPGEGSEQANFGLCLYPKKIEIIKGGNVSTKLGTNFLWKSFCKTQYASDPECGGVENFLKCHLAVISLLDHAKSLGILESVSDEGKYWEKRDLEVLVNQVGKYNEFVAAFSGALKDALSESDKGVKLISEISGHRDFERLEAGFERKNPEESDNMRKTARVIATLVGGITDDCKNKT